VGGLHTRGRGLLTRGAEEQSIRFRGDPPNRGIGGPGGSGDHRHRDPTHKSHGQKERRCQLN